MSWSDLSDWWVTEIEDDPAYETVVNPMLLDVLRPEAGRIYLDLGCGEGRVMRALKESGAVAHGVDLTPALARRAADSGPVVLGRLPDLGFLRDDSYDGAFCVLALEHIEDEVRLFRGSSTGGPTKRRLRASDQSSVSDRSRSHPDFGFRW